MENTMLLDASGYSSAQEKARVLVCNICWLPPAEPVLTSCGHLFCWPCLYLWLHLGRSKTCPFCRINVREDISITPVYGSLETGDSIAETSTASGTAIPPRPRPPFASSLESLQHPYGSGRFVFRSAALEEIEFLLAEMEGLRTQLGVHRDRLSALERETTRVGRLESDHESRRGRSA